MSVRSCVALACLVAPAVAVAAPGRVLVADSDPELVHAIESSLAPWRLTVVADPAAGDPAERAARANARFAVWREGSVLVVLDRDLGTTERRPARSGALGPVDAAAAALTVKTMMRLPPPPPLVEPSSPPPLVTPAVVVTSPPPPVARGASLRISAELGGRVEDRDRGAPGMRVRGALLVRPWADRGWRFGALIDGGPSAEVKGAGFEGTWNDLAAIALASWSTPIGSQFSIEPAIGVGVAYRVLDGTVGQAAQHDSEVDTRALASLAVRRSFGTFSIAAALSGETTPGTSTYTKEQGMSEAVIFEPPRIALALTVGVAVDLGR